MLRLIAWENKKRPGTQSLYSGTGVFVSTWSLPFFAPALIPVIKRRRPSFGRTALWVNENSRGTTRIEDAGVMRSAQILTGTYRIFLHSLHVTYAYGYTYCRFLLAYA